MKKIFAFTLIVLLVAASMFLMGCVGQSEQTGPSGSTVSNDTVEDLTAAQAQEIAEGPPLPPQ